MIEQSKHTEPTLVPELTITGSDPSCLNIMAAQEALADAYDEVIAYAKVVDDFYYSVRPWLRGRDVSRK